MDAGYVKSEIENGIATITFYHPQSNSLPAKILEALADQLEAISNDDAARVIILKSDGDGAFCAGASFDELIAIRTEAEGLNFFSGFAHVINAMRNSSKLIIARVQGKCVGGGVGIAAAADYAIAVEKADIKLSELAVGIGPFVVGPAVERKIGKAAFTALAIDASMWRNSKWATKKGLFAENHPTLQSMDESIERLSKTLAASNPEAMADLKKIFWEGTEDWGELLKQRAAISGRLVLSAFTKNAIQKFKKN